MSIYKWFTQLNEVKHFYCVKNCDILSKCEVCEIVSKYDSLTYNRVSK